MPRWSNGSNPGSLSPRSLFVGASCCPPSHLSQECARALDALLTWTADYLWTEAQHAVAADLQNPKIRETILACAEGLKADLFRVA
jgi:hypothetical protein